MTGEPEILVLRDAEAIAGEAAARFAAAVEEGVAERGRADIALTGGSSAGALYRRLADSPWRERVDWTRLHLWWGDERLVPNDHPESNAGLVYSILLDIGARTTQSGEGAASTDVLAGHEAGATVPADQVHPFPVSEAIGRGDGGGAWAAEQYAEQLRSMLPAGQDGLPAFDLILLGVGSDGHIFSVFPDSAALAPDAPLALSIPAPDHISPHVPRLTLNPRLLETARQVLVMVPGSSKAEIIEQVLGPERDSRRWPAQLARRANTTWLLDESSAARLSLDERTR
ncbi:MAG: 6-phosphogluconolactonase [Chloroflexi bacterium]|nr:6-phosphogluconolactonase [Chloroflexota bacterium]